MHQVWFGYFCNGGLDEGAWEMIGPDLEAAPGHQIHFRVTIGGRSAEIVATVSDS